MDISLTPEERQIRDTVRAFVKKELMPLEAGVLKRTSEGGPEELTRDENRELQLKAKRSGLWGIDSPEEYGGANLGHMALAITWVELGRTFLDFRFGGSAPPAMIAYMNEDQKQRYLIPVVEGEKLYSNALTEPGGGSDVSTMRTVAKRDGDDWIINGEKTWISRGDVADFVIVYAATPDYSDGRGITAFAVDRDLGWTSSPIPVMGTMTCSSLTFGNIRVPDANRIGEVGYGLDVAMHNINRMRAFHTPGRDIGACERMVEMAMASS